ncbi:MAG TPA: hypothetical protein VJN66_07120 [Rhodanobacteraceae bacterium]|nr:hypothetical protein [Rhodanobacteraceae bacterium]
MKTHGIKWLGLSVLVLAGFLMVAPSAFAASDGGYSATCKDGTTWTGTSKRGACRGHKGVKSWTSEAASNAAAEPAAKTKHERKSRSSKKSEETTSAAATTNETASASAGGAVSATCKDGTSWSGKSKRGACRGHKGVKDWGDTAAAAAPAPAPANNAPAAAPMPVSHRTSTRTASTGGAMGAPAPGGGAGKVWVNSESKTYHCQGTKWYGTTKHGEYMTESQAKSQGYHADHGKACSG